MLFQNSKNNLNLFTIIFSLLSKHFLKKVHMSKLNLDQQKKHQQIDALNV